MRTADVLRNELLTQPGVVVTDVPYQLEENGGKARKSRGGHDITDAPSL